MRSLLLILFMLISVKGNALTAYQIDSMWHVFNNTKQPIGERAYALYRLHFEYDDEDPDKALTLVNLLVSETRKYNYNIGNNVGEYYYLQIFKR